MAYRILKKHLKKMTTSSEIENFFHDWKIKHKWKLKNQFAKNAFYEITYVRLKVTVKLRLSVREKVTTVDISYHQ